METVIVLAIVVAAGAYLLRRTLRNTKSGGCGCGSDCGGCGESSSACGCGSAKTPPGDKSS
ncbi:MAG: FeoB-associated Cys-rich membrane protein [Desulfovibrionaceae bacterium]